MASVKCLDLYTYTSTSDENRAIKVDGKTSALPRRKMSPAYVSLPLPPPIPHLNISFVSYLALDAVPDPQAAAGITLPSFDLDITRSACSG